MRDRKFYHFDGLADFARDCREKDTPSGEEDWMGGTFADGVRYCQAGDVSKVADAERLVESMDDQIDTNATRPMWMPSVVGSFALVPAFLAGTPEAMLARTDVQDARGEVEIWANTTVSGSCGARDMMRRGVVTMALAMALSRVRNVKLVLYSTCEGSNVAIRLGSPLDFSEVCAAFCQPVITRGLIYGHAKRDGFEGRWSNWAEVRKGAAAERKALEECAGMTHDALRLGTEKLGDYAAVSDEELVKILNGKVREYMGRND